MVLLICVSSNTVSNRPAKKSKLCRHADAIVAQKWRETRRNGFRSFHRMTTLQLFRWLWVPFAAGSPRRKTRGSRQVVPQAQPQACGLGRQRSKTNAMKSVSIKALPKLTVTFMMTFLCFRTLSLEGRGYCKEKKHTIVGILMADLMEQSLLQKVLI